MKAPSRTAVFGPYTLDLRSGELRKFGTRVKVGEQPFQILRMLLENSGEMVSREDLRLRLWAGDTFVDFDHGLNSAMQRLRDCLSDSATTPRWIETIPRRGYRFIGQVEWSDESLPGEAPATPTAGDLAEVTRAEVADAESAKISAATPRKKLRVGPVALVAIACAVLIAVLISRRIQGVRSAGPVVNIKSIAVLPFENLSADANQEYFADGMTDELITRLAQNPSLRVISRTSVMQYKKIHRPLAEIARELGTDGILEGSVERSGNRVHLNAKLIYAPQDRHLWAESYDRDLNDLAALQSELAQTIARQVGLTTTPPSPAARRIRSEAYDAYLLGRYYWFGGKTVKSREYFLKAIQLEPDYAASYAGLADSYFLEVADSPPKPEMQAALKEGEQAVRRALALDDSDADAHLTMAAFTFFFGWDVKAAERESARAIELNPRYAQAHHVRGYILSALRRADEAVREERLSMEIDPRLHPWALGRSLLHARQYDAGIAELRARAEVQPEDEEVHGTLSDLYWQKQMFAESVRESAKTYVPKSAAELEDAFRRGGAQGAAEWRLAHTKKLQARMYVSPLDLALAAARAGHKEETLRYLEQSCEEHVPWLVLIGSEPDLDFIRSEPRYQAITKKLGLPSAL